MTRLFFPRYKHYATWPVVIFCRLRGHKNQMTWDDCHRCLRCGDKIGDRNEGVGSQTTAGQSMEGTLTQGVKQMDRSMKILIEKAYEADTAFSLAIMEAGYKSRWDWDSTKDNRPYAAYIAKVRADEAVHEAFEQSRKAI